MGHIQRSQYLGEGAVVKSDGSSKLSALYETSGKSSETDTPTASLFLINEGATKIRISVMICKQRWSHTNSPS